MYTLCSFKPFYLSMSLFEPRLLGSTILLRGCQRYCRPGAVGASGCCFWESPSGHQPIPKIIARYSRWLKMCPISIQKRGSNIKYPKWIEKSRICRLEYRRGSTHNHFLKQMRQGRQFMLFIQSRDDDSG